MTDPVVARTFEQLAAFVVEQPGVAAVHQALVDLAPHVVPGCDHASLMLAKGSGYVTAASSDATGALVDRLERECGEGPCVDAVREVAYELAPDVAEECCWPRLAERVLQESPVRGMAGYRIVVEDHKVGALNLFTDTAGGFTRASGDAGVLLAAFATTALAGAGEHARAESLSRGLQSNREIGTAVGLLMATHGVSHDRAFEVLRQTSSELNVKLADLARRVVSDASR